MFLACQLHGGPTVPRRILFIFLTGTPFPEPGRKTGCRIGGKSFAEPLELFVGLFELTLGGEHTELDGHLEDVFHRDHLEVAACRDGLAGAVIDGYQDLVTEVLVVHTVRHDDGFPQIPALAQGVFELTPAYVFEDLDHTGWGGLGLECGKDPHVPAGGQAGPPEPDPGVFPVLADNLVADLLRYEKYQVGLAENLYEQGVEIGADKVHADDRIQDADRFTLLRRSLFASFFHLLLGQSPTPSKPPSGPLY